MIPTERIKNNRRATLYRLIDNLADLQKESIQALCHIADNKIYRDDLCKIHTDIKIVQEVVSLAYSEYRMVDAMKEPPKVEIPRLSQHDIDLVSQEIISSCVEMPRELQDKVYEILKWQAGDVPDIEKKENEEDY